LDIPAGLLKLSPEEPPVKAQAHCLQCSDPRVVARYNSLLHQRLLEQNIFACTSSLVSSISGLCLTKTQQTEYKAINKISVEDKCFAEQNCWKIKAGKAPWCPLISHSINQILYWKGIYSKIQGHHIGSSVLKSWAKKGSLSHKLVNLHLPPETILTHIDLAYKVYNQFKKEPLRHDTWLASLIDAQATLSNKTKWALWKQIRATKKAHDTTRKVCSVLMDTWHSVGLSMVIGPTFEGLSHQESHPRQTSNKLA